MKKNMELLSIIILSGILFPTMGMSGKNPIDSFGITVLDNPTLTRIPTAEEMKHDPLTVVAEELRKHIDPTMSEKWPDGYKQEYVEHITKIYDGYREFWKRIPAKSRRYVDLNNNESTEYVVFSEGMNADIWGFANFIVILGKPLTDIEKNGKWEIFHLQTMPYVHETYYEGTSKWEDFDIIFTDLDRDGRTDMLFTTTQIGASHTRNLNAISVHPDMKIRHHVMTSNEPWKVLQPETLRPVLVQHHFDQWGEKDFGIAIRDRGYRKAYFRWNVWDGFVRF